MRWLCSAIIVTAFLLGGTSFAHEEPTSPSASSQPSAILDQLTELDHSRLAILLIFGTGFVSAVLWGMGAVIGAMRRDVPSGDQLRLEIAALEERVRTLEQALRVAAPAGNGAAQVR